MLRTFTALGIVAALAAATLAAPAAAKGRHGVSQHHAHLRHQYGQFYGSAAPANAPSTGFVDPGVAARSRPSAGATARLSAAAGSEAP